MRADSATVAWTSWPARERPGAAIGGAVGVLAFGLAGGAFGGSWPVGLATTLALVVFLHRFWFPVRCDVTAGQARVRTVLGTQVVPLARIRRVAQDRRAVMLSSRAARSNLDSTRAFIMPLPAADSETIVRELLVQIERARSAEAKSA